MSTQSGITASKELLDSFKSLSSEPLIIKISDDNTELVTDSKLGAVSSGKEHLSSAFESVNAHLKESFPSPAYVVIPVDPSADDYVFISFIPDSAPIRSKMLYASTKNTLLTSLGSNKFSKSNSFAWTELEELTYEYYQKVISATNNDDVLSKDEKMLNELNTLQTLSLAGSTSSFKRELASMHSPSPSPSIHGPGNDNILYKFDSSLQEEFQSLSKNADTNKLITFNIDSASEVIKLTTSETGIALDSLLDSLAKANPVARPQYSIYNFYRGKFAFIYSCPSNSKVKDRMLYAASKVSLIHYLKTLLSEDSLTIDKSIEVGDLDEIELSELTVETEAATPSSVSSASSAGAGSGVGRQGLKFSKPKGPRRR
ncbi:hypothetical protein G9P44_002826 [Scheffersomyces stipitis]|nr:hypothetical protein G9P44_002826 [Scheffersomyces stipitis]